MKTNNKSSTNKSLVSVKGRIVERIPRLLFRPPNSEEIRMEKIPAAKTSRIAAVSAIREIAKTFDLRIGSCVQR